MAGIIIETTDERIELSLPRDISGTATLYNHFGERTPGIAAQNRTLSFELRGGHVAVVVIE